MTLNCLVFTTKKLEYTEVAMILTNPDDIQKYRLKVIASGLNLEIKTGMRHSRNATLKAAQAITGKKTRVACLAEIQKLLLQ
jgi:hypothetical protein